MTASMRSPDALPRRLLFVVNTAWFFMSHRLPIAEALMRAGVEVHLAAPAGDDLEEVAARGIVVHPLRLSRSGLNPVRELETIGDLVALYRRLRPDVIHHVTPKPVLYGSIAARLARMPAIVNAISGLGHAFVGTDRRARVMRAVASLLYRGTFRHPNAHTIFQNPSDRDILETIVPQIRGRSTLIPGSGVHLSAFSPTPFADGPVTVLLAARMLANKGVREFVAAARVLRHSGHDLRLALVGEPDTGNPTSIARDELASWADEGVVEWWGKRSDMPQVLAAAHIFCLPSHGGEGVPKSVIEAMACGRPVVTTDVPGCRDAVIDGETGLVVPPRNVDALVDALVTLAADASRRSQMGEAARARAEAMFSIEAVVNAHLSIYRRVAATTPRAS